jgi:hypothetical protein
MTFVRNCASSSSSRRWGCWPLMESGSKSEKVVSVGEGSRAALAIR